MNSPGAQRKTGRVALVTGAASGIGRAIARRFAAEGARVALADLNLPEAKRVAREIRSIGSEAISIASAAGIKPLAGNAAYGTSKAAIRFFTQVAALEGKPHGIRVNSISPGAVATPMWGSTDLWPEKVAESDGTDAALKALVQKQGFAKPEEIAAAVAFLASEEARQITGTDLAVDAGFSIG